MRESEACFQRDADEEDDELLFGAVTSELSSVFRLSDGAGISGWGSCSGNVTESIVVEWRSRRQKCSQARKRQSVSVELSAVVSSAYARSNHARAA